MAHALIRLGSAVIILASMMNKPTLRFQGFLRLGLAALALSFVVVAGCGLEAKDLFANRLLGAQGQQFVVEDLEAIAHDATLTADEKRQQFRDLGIEDEKLIDALLGL